MPTRGPSTPLVLALLRGLALTGLIEAVFFRLMPAPSPAGASSSAGAPSLLLNVHDSLHEAGQLSWVLAFILLVATLVAVGSSVGRTVLWPGALTALLASGALLVTALGLLAMTTGRGRAFAFLFTLVALLVALTVAMQAFVAKQSGWIAAFAVCYGAAMISSAVATLGSSMVEVGAPGPRSLDFLAGSALAGETLLAVSGGLAFMAFTGTDRQSPAVLVGVLAGSLFAAGSLLLPADAALLGARPGAMRVITLSVGLFLGVTAAVGNLLQPERRSLGYGLMLLILCGFPVRIAYQHMMMVLGAVLTFAPFIGQSPRDTGSLSD